MNKLLSSVGLAIGIAMVSLLAGCQLYFGDSNDRSGDRPGRPDIGSPPGYACDTDADCAAGCFCNEDGTCDEGGFCNVDDDCGEGFQCDKERASCIPSPACKCSNDAEAVAQGAGWCNEATGTCEPGTDPAGACTGALTCTTSGPKCPAGEVPLLKDGCYTGACRAIAACEGPPVCNALQHEGDCISRNGDCGTVYNGHGCTKPSGDACRVGDVDCTCTSFTFAACEPRGENATRIVPE